MQQQLNLLFIAYLFLVSVPVAYGQVAVKDPEVLVAQAVELLQKNKRDEALRLLEQAFELAADSERIREIGALIIEASPYDYEKRESYLRYLIKFSGEHPDQPKWQKELGDRAFEKGELTAAEDFYFRALARHSDKEVINYKLAWIYWNQKKKTKAFKAFLDIYTSGAKALIDQIPIDVAKLWWEIGELPPIPFADFSNLKAADQKKFLSALFKQVPNKASDSKTVERVFLQLKTQNSSQIELKSFLSKGFSLESDSCMIFYQIIDPGDVFPPQQLLRCFQSPERPSDLRLLSLFEQIPPPRRDENVDLATAELLFKLDRTEFGLNLLFQSGSLAKRSTQYHDYLLGQILKMNSESFSLLESSMEYEKLEELYTLTKSTALLNNLQAVNPGRWLAFEERSKAKESLSKSFWEKKAVFVAQETPEDHQALSQLAVQIFSFELTKPEANFQKALSDLRDAKTTQMPKQFGEDFQSAYQAWLVRIDSSLTAFNQAPESWRLWGLTLFQNELQANVESMARQIRDLKLPADIQDMAVEFERRRRELNRDLAQKYQGFLAAREGD